MSFAHGEDGSALPPHLLGAAAHLGGALAHAARAAAETRNHVEQLLVGQRLALARGSGDLLLAIVPRLELVGLALHLGRALLHAASALLHASGAFGHAAAGGDPRLGGGALSLADMVGAQLA